MGIAGATVSDVRDTPDAPDAPDTPEAGAVAPSARPVFVDTTGRRSRTWRRAGAVTALCCVCYATTVAASLVGGDSSAPFLQLPRAMGLERGTGEPSAPAEDADRTASATGPALGAPGPVSPGPVAPGPARPSVAVLPVPPQPLEQAFAHPGANAGPSAPPVRPQPSGPASGGGAQTGADGAESVNEPVGEPVNETSPPAQGTGATPDPRLRPPAARRPGHRRARTPLNLAGDSGTCWAGCSADYWEAPDITVRP
nr:hypothetical protein OG284_34070 [Streptomyces sp. NBC_01177]